MKYKFLLFFVILWILCSLISAQETDDSAKLNFYNDLVNTEISIIYQKKPLKLKDIKNKVIIVLFFASWSGPCQNQLKDLKTIKKEFQKDDLFIIGLDVEEDDKNEFYESLGKRKVKTSAISGSSSNSKEFWKDLKQNKFNYPIGFAKNDLFGSLLKVSKKDAVPQTVIIYNAEVKEIYVGTNKIKKIQQTLKEVFDKK